MSHLLKYIIILFSCILISCSEYESFDSESDEAATLRINIKNDNSSVSRAITDANINTIESVSILIFNSNGDYIGGKINSSSSSSIEIKTRVTSDCTIYAFANISDNSIFNGINTISDLNNLCETISSPEALVSDKGSIMSGKIENVTITKDGENTYNLALEHIFSKVSFNITTASSNIKISSYQLCHIPLSGFLTSPNEVSQEITSSSKYDNFEKKTLTNTTSTNFSYYMFENIAGYNTTCTSESDRYLKNAPENVSYLTFTATNGTWTSIYFVLLGGVSQSGVSNTYSDFNVYRNKAYSINITVGANGAIGENNKRVIYSTESGSFTNITGTATIGDIFYDDGTTVASGTNTPVGIVFSNTISVDDYLAGYTHGYVLALKNASPERCIWSTSTTTMPTERSFSDVTLAREMTDMNGAYYTSKVIGAGNSSVYPACWYAYLYRSSNNVPEIIEGTSGWFLPSFGQFYQLCVSLGGMGNYIANGIANSLGYTKGASWIYWCMYGSTSSSNTTNCQNGKLFAQNINNLIKTKVADSNLYEEIVDGNGTTTDNKTLGTYWSSSEYSKLYAYRLALWSDDDRVDIGTCCINKDVLKCNVRAILAY